MSLVERPPGEADSRFSLGIVNLPNREFQLSQEASRPLRQKPDS